jgi:hypothetical protein
MILWIGEYSGYIAIRCLGPSGMASKCLRQLKDHPMVATTLRHNEGTTSHDGTSPTVGSGEAKKCRDYGIMGLGVGSNVGYPEVEPTTLGAHNCCVLAYDIESEFAGQSNSTFQSAILCVSIKCTCGYEHVVTRSKLIGSKLPHTVMTSNATIAVEVMRLIILHTPIFTVGHNVYAFENTVLAKALPKDHKFTSYFQMVHKSDNKASTTVGLVMTVPGINNIDT